MAHIRIIGDVHQMISNDDYETHIAECEELEIKPRFNNCYQKLTEDSKYSVQVGDLGFYYMELYDINPNFHKVIAGNHDNYNILKNYKHFLNDYGTFSFPLKDGKQFDFFYIRGAKSPDWKSRTEGINWFREEELSWDQGEKAIELYEKTKPKIVISHTAPEFIIPEFACPPEVYYKMFNEWPLPSSTNQLLQTCFDIYRPEYWIFGHFHRTKKIIKDGTNFICIGILDHLDINENGEINDPSNPNI